MHLIFDVDRKDCVCVYTHTYIHARIHSYIHVSKLHVELSKLHRMTLAGIHTYTHTYLHAYIHAYMQPFLHAYMPQSCMLSYQNLII